MRRRKKFGGGIEVTIPDAFLAVPKKENYVIYAYIYVTNSDAGETTAKAAIKVKARPGRQGQIWPGEIGVGTGGIRASKSELDAMISEVVG